MIFCCLQIFSNITFQNILQNNIRLSKSLDPDQAVHNIWPDLGSDCLQRLSADNKIGRYQAELTLCLPVLSGNHAFSNSPNRSISEDNFLKNKLFKIF